MTQRPKLPGVIRGWSWANLALVLGFLAVRSLVSAYLPLVAIVFAAAAIQIGVGALLVVNDNGIADRWAEWGRSRHGFSSPALIRFQGAGLMSAGIFLVGVAIWMIASLRPLV